MDGNKPYLAVLLVQSTYSVMFLFSKAVHSMSATLFINLLELFRSIPKEKLVITLSLNFCGVALTYTSASLAAATTNCLPVITFFLAVLLTKLGKYTAQEVRNDLYNHTSSCDVELIVGACMDCLDYQIEVQTDRTIKFSTELEQLMLNYRMETVKLKTTPGIAMVAGITICMAGAATIAIYRSPSLKLLLHHHLFGDNHSQERQLHVLPRKTWKNYCFLMLLSNTFWGFWLVLQLGTSEPGRLAWQHP
ncbi:WAT1-related protein At5g64700-like [Cornus florida]|uniref:WAT1-related protein At5g64700-like n=1 Tax=Cornus florida TaxID=4283 RepID=UPI00289D1F38|nr:WAT1-related protein At5g64700-like [Cornus florida]